MNFCVAVLILKMEENKHFWHIILPYIKKGKNAAETQKKRFMQCREEMLWLIEHVKSSLRNFILGISHWTMLHWENQLKLIVIESSH